MPGDNQSLTIPEKRGSLVEAAAFVVDIVSFTGLYCNIFPVYPISFCQVLRLSNPPQSPSDSIKLIIAGNYHYQSTNQTILLHLFPAPVWQHSRERKSPREV